MQSLNSGCGGRAKTTRGRGVEGGRLVLARFFFGSFLFINGKEMNGNHEISWTKSP